MAERNERGLEEVEQPKQSDLAQPGGKHQWQRLVDSIPSSEEEDPKLEEPTPVDRSKG